MSKQDFSGWGDSKLEVKCSSSVVLWFILTVSISGSNWPLTDFQTRFRMIIYTVSVSKLAVPPFLRGRSRWGWLLNPSVIQSFTRTIYQKNSHEYLLFLGILFHHACLIEIIMRNARQWKDYLYQYKRSLKSHNCSMS